MSKALRSSRPNQPHSALRVISGHYKGTSLQSPQSSVTHPMGSREKLALFNMIDVRDQVILDAYAGSGALGIEAISRGAREIIFVEKSPLAARTISSNLAHLESEAINSTKIFTISAAKFSENPDYHAYFDIILADPPYDDYRPAEISALVQLLKPGGTFALSSPARMDAPDLPGLEPIKTRSYASARISLYLCR